MKFGDYFEAQSVPRWSIHNIDYNSLKLQIKIHTARNQATAIAIPGQMDYALVKFENAFYDELHGQHDRVDLFVSSKADEISRRLRHLASLIDNLLLKCSTSSRGITPKRQRKLARYQLQTVECDNDIRDLDRFVNAQDVAFRKILKKYKKWTGSTTLGSRFRENVLHNPKSFTKRDFGPIQQQCRELVAKLEAAAPTVAFSSEGSISSPRRAAGSKQNSRRPSQISLTPQPEQPPIQRQTLYWNEYDNGSDAGDELYVIYTNPDDSETFPGLSRIQNIFSAPVKKIKTMFSVSEQKHAEHQPLLNGNDRSPTDYLSARHSHHTTDNEATEDEDASSLEYPSLGYSAHYAALPSIEEQRIEHYRAKVLHRTAIVSFCIAIILLVVGSVLVFTGRHKLRLEVDAGACFAVVVSLFAACMGLGAMLYREDKVGSMYQLATWTSFMTMCMLNGMLLVIIMGRIV